MLIYENLHSFAGDAVIEWEPQVSLETGHDIFYRVRLSVSDLNSGVLWSDKFKDLLIQQNTEYITGLIIGCWEQPSEIATVQSVLAELVAAREYLPNLRALFFGDVT